jgi:transcriptional regulatory protein RtcR
MRPSPAWQTLVPGGRISTQVVDEEASRSLSEAGRTLFGASRTRKSISNDADRLRKYLGRFDLEFSQIQN